MSRNPEMTDKPVSSDRSALDPDIRLRCAKTLVLTLEEESLTVHNFLQRKLFTCSPRTVDFLYALHDWRKPEELIRHFSDYSADSVIERLSELLEYGAVVAEGTPEALADQHYRERWDWGLVGGFFHYSVRDQKYLGEEEQRKWMRKRRRERGEIPLLKTNESLYERTRLPEMDVENDPLFRTMYQRRSIRRFRDRPLTLEQVSDCLFSAKGVTGYVTNPDYGNLPLTMTPSGGARNPYELYLYAADVDGLKTGLYHYSGLDHDLGLIHAGVLPVTEMLGGQKWTAEAGAIVFYAANFYRSSLKYHTAPAYRVVMIEAGCIIQNIALAATHHGLTAVPTGALAESLIEKYVPTRAIDEAVVFASVLGVPEPVPPR